jgi:hypothetical protein
MDRISKKEILLSQRRESHRPGGKMGNNKYTRKVKHKNKEIEND